MLILVSGEGKMKKKLFGSLLCIGLVGITLMGARRQKKPPAQTVSRLRISSAGGLQSLHDQSGRELLGGGNHAMREGYVLRYQTRQGERLVYAVGNRLSGLIGQKTMPATGVTATAIAKTADGALEISSGYKLDVEKNQLSIIRRIRNVSSESVTLSLAQNYVDPRLFSDPEANHQLSIEKRFPIQPSSGENAGPVGFSPGQAGYSGSQLTTPNRMLDEFLGKDMGLIVVKPSDCIAGIGGCPPDPICTKCVPPARLGAHCDLCQQVNGPDAEPCCAEGRLEGIRPQARIYSTRVGRSVYYDAAMSFLPETAVLTLHPPSTSMEESKKNREVISKFKKALKHSVQVVLDEKNSDECAI
jgi:hypothetical protein